MNYELLEDFSECGVKAVRALITCGYIFDKEKREWGRYESGRWYSVITYQDRLIGADIELESIGYKFDGIHWISQDRVKEGQAYEILVQLGFLYDVTKGEWVSTDAWKEELRDRCAAKEARKYLESLGYGYDGEKWLPTRPKTEEKFVDARESEAAINTLVRVGYTYHGGELWKPPIGNAPVFGQTPASIWEHGYNDGVKDGVTVLKRLIEAGDTDA